LLFATVFAIRLSSCERDRGLLAMAQLQRETQIADQNFAEQTPRERLGATAFLNSAIKASIRTCSMSEPARF